MNAQDLIDTAIKLKGSQSKLAIACGVSQAAIWKARKAGRVSAQMALAIERGTGGQLARWRLRPDLWEQPRSSQVAA